MIELIIRLNPGYCNLLYVFYGYIKWRLIVIFYLSEESLKPIFLKTRIHIGSEIGVGHNALSWLPCAKNEASELTYE